MLAEAAPGGAIDYSCDTPDLLCEHWPGSHQLFPTRPGVELNQPLSEREPIIHSLLNNVIGNIHRQDYRAALVRELCRFPTGKILWPAEKERAGFNVHRETV